MGMAIQTGVLGISAVELIRWLEIAPRECVMKGCDELHAAFANGLFQLGGEITPGCLIHAVPFGIFRVPHGIVVVMNCYRPGEFRARLGEQLRPHFGIEFLRLEHLYHVFIADLVLVAIFFQVILIRRAAFHVHAASVPLDTIRSIFGADGHRPPVSVDAELGIAKPLRDLVF